MAGRQDLLITLQQNLASFDDQALIALANKGLLRRAHKDLEAAAPVVQDDSGEELIVTTGGVQVTLPITGPTQARCSCPAVGICRHILTVCVWLRSQGSQAPGSQGQSAGAPGLDSSSAASAQGLAGEEGQSGAVAQSWAAAQVETAAQTQLLTYTCDQIMKWASQKRVRTASEQLASGLAVPIELGDPVVFRFVDLNVTTRYFSATGLEGMICSCKAAQICLHRVMAVLAYRQQQGIETAVASSRTQDKVAIEAPRSREQVITTALEGLAEAITVGILHLSESTRQRWVTLAVSAQGVNLHRLSLALRSLADQLELLLNRDAKASETRLFAAMAHTYALAQALIQAPLRSDLVGQARSHYIEVGSLELIGMGAYHWQTPSGYTGLTLLFWDPAAQNWCSWSEARPRFHQTGFNPETRYHQAGPWPGITSPAQACRSRLTLLGAKRNPQRRLSSAQQIQAIPLGPTRVEQLDLGSRLFTDWSRLSQYIATTLPMGLQASDAMAALVVVQPQTWGSRSFDPVTQLLRWDLWDDQDRLLTLQVPYRATDIHRIQALEALDPESRPIWGIVGQGFVRQAGLWLYPLSLLIQPEDPHHSSVLPLSFPGQIQPQGATPALDPSQGEPEIPTDTSLPLNAEDDAEDPDRLDLELTPIFSPLERQIAELMDQLQLLSESGSHRLTETLRQDLSRSSYFFEQAAMGILARHTQYLSEGTDQAHQILRLGYLCQLAREALIKAQLY